MTMYISYETLYLKSKEIENKLIEKEIITASIQGRFKEYQKEIHQLATTWKRRKENKVNQKITFGGKQVLALKELREIIEVIGLILFVYNDLSNKSKEIVKLKLNQILTGSTYTINEGGSTSARNFQFEFRLAAKMIEAKYSVLFFENPDICVERNGRRYAIECKRLTGKSSRVIQSNIEEATEQLIRNRNGYYAGIIALDVSALLDNRSNLLTSYSKESAGNKILNDIETMLFRDFKRYQKLKKYSHSHIVSLIYNFSGSYVIPNVNDVGWAQGTGVLIFSKENPSKAKKFDSDFAEYQKGTRVTT